MQFLTDTVAQRARETLSAAALEATDCVDAHISLLVLTRVRVTTLIQICNMYDVPSLLLVYDY